MLQKLENFYLGILRMVTILVAGGFLVAVVLFGLRSMTVFRPAPEPDPVKPEVSSVTFQQSLMGTNTSTAGNQSHSEPATPKIRDEYARAAKLVSDFYKNRATTRVDLDNGKLAEYFASGEPEYETDDLKEAYAKGLLTRLTELVASPAFVKWESYKSLEEVMVGIVTTYKTEFDAELAKANALNEAKQTKHALEKAESLQSLYVAGGAFMAFLLIVFLSIIIRIERNLRPPSKLQPQA